MKQNCPLRLNKTAMNIHQQQEPHYESIEFNVNTATTDYDLDSQQATFLAVFGAANNGRCPTYVEIRTNNTISVKLNSTSNHAITIASTDSPYVIAGVLISNIYITNNSGSTAAVKLRLQDNPA